MLDIVIEYAVNIFDAFLAAWFVLKFNKASFKRNKQIFVVVISLFTTANLFYHFANNSLLLVTTVYLVILILFAFTIRGGNITSKILSPLIFILTLIITNSLCLVLVSGGMAKAVVAIWFEQTLIRYMYIVLCKIIMTSVLVLILRVFSINGKFKPSDLFLYLISPLVTAMVLYTYMLFSINHDISPYIPLVVSVIVVLIILNVSMIIIFKRTVQNTQAKYELEMINSRKDLEEQRYKELNDVYHQLQLTRHDLKDHLLYIENLISEKRYEEANRYISERKDEINASKKIRLTGDRLLDFIIDSKLSPYDDIRYSVRGKLEQLENIEEIDIAVLFGNILDNAVRGVADASDKYIELSFSVTGNYQNIICRNTIGSSVLANNASLSTTKTDKTRHGYGTKSIRRIVEKYSGLLEFSEGNGNFCVQIALPIDRK